MLSIWRFLQDDINLPAQTVKPECEWGKIRVTNVERLNRVTQGMSTDKEWQKLSVQLHVAPVLRLLMESRLFETNVAVRSHHVEKNSRSSINEAGSNSRFFLLTKRDENVKFASTDAVCFKKNVRNPVWTCRDPIFFDSRDPMITFSDSRNPIFNSRDPNRISKTP